MRDWGGTFQPLLLWLEDGNPQRRQGQLEGARLIMPGLVDGLRAGTVGEPAAAELAVVGIQEFSIEARFRDTHPVADARHGREGVPGADAGRALTKGRSNTR